MELSNLIADDDLAWRAYASQQWALMALLCLWIPTRWVRWSLMMVFASSAVDEATARNLFGEGLWEYPVWAVCTAVIYLIQKRWP